MNYRHTRGESEYIYLTAYNIIHKYNFFPAGLPTAEATGPRLRGQPLRVLFCWPVIAPRSWLRRFAPTRNFVAGCGVVLDQGNIAGTKNEVARRPRFRRFAPTDDSSLAPGNNLKPHPNSVGPSQASATIGQREPASQNEKHVVWAYQCPHSQSSLVRKRK